MIAGSDDNCIYVFSNSTRTPTFIYETNFDVTSVAISGNGIYIIAGSSFDIYFFNHFNPSVTLDFYINYIYGFIVILVLSISTYILVYLKDKKQQQKHIKAQKFSHKEEKRERKELRRDRINQMKNRIIQEINRIESIDKQEVLKIITDGLITKNDLNTELIKQVPALNEQQNASCFCIVNGKPHNFEIKQDKNGVPEVK